MLQLSCAEVDFGGRDRVSPSSWASDSEPGDVLKNVMSQKGHINDLERTQNVFGFPWICKIGRPTVLSRHDVLMIPPQWPRLQLVLQCSSAAWGKDGKDARKNRPFTGALSTNITPHDYVHI